ncbi:MAG TPA: radical SAM protein [Tissierellaceae bacterium]|mgnify:CR=1 FL=1
MEGKNLLAEVYKEYGNYFYVPMTQGYSVAVPVTIGCSWDKCLYCDLNHDNKFKFLGLNVIEDKLKILKEIYSNRRKPVKKIVLAGGNPFCLDTDTLIKIIHLIKEYFPQVENISSFARADDILRKSKDELKELKNLGVGELSIGVESGNDEILEFHNKGVTREDNYKAMKILEECNISYSTYIMLGLGGKKLSRENAIDTASLLSMVNPEVIIVVTLVIFKDAKLVEKLRNKEFERLGLLDLIKEERLLLENLNMRNTIFNATHKTNTLILKGKLPEQKELLLKKIDRAIQEFDSRKAKNYEINRWRIWSIEK